MIHKFVLIVLASVSISLAAEPAAFKLDAPADWGGETIRLPPGFAKGMSVKGVEHIRFAPGMMDAKSDTFFCYAFVFELEPSPAFSQDLVESEILKYYRGLSEAVLNGKLPDLDTAKFSLKLERNANKADETLPKGALSYKGILKWVEPFATKKKQVLNLEIQTWGTGQRSFMFVCVSPKKAGAKIWIQLRNIRDAYFDRIGS